MPFRFKRIPMFAQILIWTTTSLLILILFGAALLPSFLSTEKGKTMTVALFNRTGKGTLAVEEVQLSWLQKQQQIKGFSYEDSKGKKRVTFDAFSSDRSLLSILFKRNIGTSQLLHPSLALHREATKEKESKEKEEKKRKERLHLLNNCRFPFTGNLNIKNGTLEFSSSKLPLTRLTDLTLDIESNHKKKRTLFHLDGKSVQGNNAGDIFVDFRLQGANSCLPFFWKGKPLLLNRGEKADISAKLTHLPAGLIDTLLGSTKASEALGQQLDLILKLDATDSQLNGEMEINAPYLKGKLAGKTEGNLFFFAPSHLSWTITPSLFSSLIADLPQGKSWRLADKAEVSLNVDSFSFPISKEEKDLKIRGGLGLSRAELIYKDKFNTSISDLQANFSSSFPEDISKVNFSAKIQGTDGGGNLRGNLLISHLFDEKGAWKPQEATYAFQMDEVTLPTSFIEFFLPTKTPLSSFIGRSFTFSGRGLLSRKGEFEVTLKSPILNSDTIRFKMTDALESLAPFHVDYKITPELLKELTHSAEDIRITEGGIVHLDVEKLFVPLQASSSPNLEAKFALDSMTLLASSQPAQTLKSVVGTITTPESKRISLHSSGTWGVEKSPHFSSILLGPSTLVQFSSELAWSDKNEFSIPVAEFDLKNDHLNAALTGEMDKEGVFTLKAPAKAHYILTPTQMSEWPFEKRGAFLTAPAEVDITLPSFEISLFPFSLQSMKFKGKGEIDRLHFTEPYQLSEGSIENATFNVDCDGNLNTCAFSVHGQSSVKEQTQPLSPGYFSIDAMVNHFIQEDKLAIKKSDVEFNASMEDFPLFLIDMWKNTQGEWIALLGPSVDLDLKGKYTPQSSPRSTFQLKAEAHDFFAKLAFAYDGHFRLLPATPAEIRWEMTPERYLTLLDLFKKGDNPQFILENTTPVSIFLSELECPAISPAELSNFFCQSGLVGTFDLGPMDLRNTLTQERIFIEKTQGKIDGRNFSESLGIEANSYMQVGGESSSIDMAFELLHAWNAEGKWAPDSLILRGDANLKNLPIVPLTQLLPIQDETRRDLWALLGERGNATISAEISQFNGPVTIVVNSTNLQAYLPLEIRDNTLFLRDVVEANISLTPALGETLLKDVSPLLITAAYSDEPVRLFIDPTNFRIPLRPYSLYNVEVEKAVLDLGRIRVRNGGELQSLMSFLKAKDISHEGEMPAWFTPMFLSMKNGVLYVKRFDALLAQNVHIASWGHIDLLKDKVRMILAIGPTTMRQNFGVFGLTKGDMFQIKMRGSTGKVKLDWTNAYTRIGILIARTAGGPPGYLIGGLVELIGGTLGEEPTPLPTTSPFPWERGGGISDGMPQEAPGGTKRKSPLKRLFDFLIP